ncbi:MAG TPA: hypothetical protein EYO90_06410, partial [Candidatus Latescibacteria bacterium]|nr:hypothetical protein [Candidatus Latescibacterota bacterium]
AARFSGAAAFEEARVTPADIKYASISTFQITPRSRGEVRSARDGRCGPGHLEHLDRRGEAGRAGDAQGRHRTRLLRGHATQPAGVAPGRGGVSTEAHRATHPLKT